MPVVYCKDSSGQSPEADQVVDDPVVDTPMIITLDRLKPYDFNPRITRNPKYDEIKASIRQRGLDAPPSITRRPGESCFRIRNGGNTRLSILRELWTETRDNQFFELTCVFRPWSQRGEIVALTGHLAENELRGGLTFIERALGVEKARGLYELEDGAPLSQSELSRRLTSDGYPIQQSHISRMRDAVDFLLPAIPSLLYGGLGRHQVERIAVMRRSMARVWQDYPRSKTVNTDFPSLFHEVLQTFDGACADFSIARLQVELLGQMALHLGVEYEILQLASEAGEKREHVLITGPYQPVPETSKATSFAMDLEALPPLRASGTEQQEVVKKVSASGHDETAPFGDFNPLNPPIAEQADDESGFGANPLLHAQGQLFLIATLWDIDPGLDEPQHLQSHISQFAREICQDVIQADLITETDEGIGFRCAAETPPAHPASLSLIGLLETLTTGIHSTSVPLDIAPLLLGTPSPSAHMDRLSDANLLKLFRLIRLARRLIDLKSENESNAAFSPPEAT
ncbi:ParB family protein [Pseudomonas koreensis]|uniref:ParB family protein of integrating conjugative element (PFGI_1 class) n=1 Tax=Pseudomonas koreensis TaxID=198620 RepID=A0A9X2XE40_9PSED|nr:ParB family protein [Pseudomonas koreensis]MCU7247270.1 hypothetical protein [Pseudomonas koreensis]